MPVQQEDSLKQQLGKKLWERQEAIRSRRMTVERRWLSNREVLFANDYESRFRLHDTAAGPYKIPDGRTSLERTIVRGAEILTPRTKWYEVIPMNQGLGNKQEEDRLATNVDKFMDMSLQKWIKTTTNILQHMRSMVVTGRTTQRTSIMYRNGKARPTQRVVDQFCYYTFPETATVQDDIEFQFEDFTIPYEKYLTLAQKGIVDEVKEEDITATEWPYHLVQRLAAQGITDPGHNLEMQSATVREQLARAGGTYCNITESWITREDKLYQVFHLRNHKGGSRCVGFIQSVYDEPTYRTTIHRSFPGETYTTELAGDIVELDRISNDLANKFMEQVDREQGMFFVDSSVGRHDSWKFKGGAIWNFNGNPRDLVQFVQPPIVSTNILRSWQIMNAKVATVGGTGSMAEGMPGRNMPRSGSSVNNLIELSLADIKNMARLIEREVLTDGLYDIYKVSSQFIPDWQLMRIPGGVGLASSGNSTQGILRKQDILGDYEFAWIGSIQSAENEEQTQKEMILFNLVTNPAVNQQLQQQGYAVNLAEFIRMLWHDSLGIRGLTDIVIPTSEMQVKTSQVNPPPPDQGRGDQGGGGEVPPTGGDPAASSSLAVPQLNYDLPALTNGFVRK
jgi:hypothetical protein